MFVESAYSERSNHFGMTLASAAAASPGYCGGSEAREATPRVEIDIAKLVAFMLSKALPLGCCGAAKAAAEATGGGGQSRWHVHEAGEQRASSGGGVGGRKTRSRVRLAMRVAACRGCV